MIQLIIELVELVSGFRQRSSHLGVPSIVIQPELRLSETHEELVFLGNQIFFVGNHLQLLNGLNQFDLLTENELEDFLFVLFTQVLVLLRFDYFSLLPFDQLLEQLFEVLLVFGLQAFFDLPLVFLLLLDEVVVFLLLLLLQNVLLQQPNPLHFESRQEPANDLLDVKSSHFPPFEPKLRIEILLRPHLQNLPIINEQVLPRTLG